MAWKTTDGVVHAKRQGFSTVCGVSFRTYRKEMRDQIGYWFDKDKPRPQVLVDVDDGPSGVETVEKVDCPKCLAIKAGPQGARPNCRSCRKPLKRFAFWHPETNPDRKWGGDGQGIFCTTDCGYAFAVAIIREIDKRKGKVA